MAWVGLGWQHEDAVDRMAKGALVVSIVGRQQGMPAGARSSAPVVIAPVRDELPKPAVLGDVFV